MLRYVFRLALPDKWTVSRKNPCKASHMTWQITIYWILFLHALLTFVWQNSETLLEIEFMKCELMVQSLGEKKENYSKSVVEVSIWYTYYFKPYCQSKVSLILPWGQSIKSITCRAKSSFDCVDPLQALSPISMCFPSSETPPSNQETWAVHNDSC